MTKDQLNYWFLKSLKIAKFSGIDIFVIGQHWKSIKSVALYGYETLALSEVLIRLVLVLAT